MAVGQLSAPDYAAPDGADKVVPYTGYVDVDVNAAGTIADASNANVRIKVNGPATSISTLPITRINTLMFGDGVTVSGADQTVGIGTGNTLVFGQNGGVFNTTLLAGTRRNLVLGANVATGGTVTAGDGTAPANINFVMSPINIAAANNGSTTVNAAITDNNGQPVSVTIRGGYVTALNTANTYSGGTYVLSGRLSQPTGATVGTGPIYVYPGGMMNPGAAADVTISNNLFIAGNGTTENNGLGAIRMFQNADNRSTLMSGTVTLMADASVSSNGNNNALRNVGVTGRITGPGGLGIGSPVTNSNNGQGTVVIGAITGVGVRNDYAGDTTINGVAGGGATLKIGNADADHVMPHGASGSFAGGATGNVVLNSVSQIAVVDLNGSQQTINGLRNTATNVTGNTVTNTSASKSVLYVGDSSATATFDGFLTGALSIVKIGSGTQTLTGANSYTDDTRVFGGTLSVSMPSLSTVGDVQVMPAPFWT